MTQETVSEQAAPKKLVLSLVRRINEDKTRVQSINGSTGQEIKDGVEGKHLHSGALKAVARLVRMDPEKRDDFLRAYRLYFDYAEEAKMFGAAHVGDLVDNAEDSAGAEAAASLGDIVDENVRRLRRGIKQDIGESVPGPTIGGSGGASSYAVK